MTRATGHAYRHALEVLDDATRATVHKGET